MKHTHTHTHTHAHTLAGGGLKGVGAGEGWGWYSLSHDWENQLNFIQAHIKLLRWEGMAIGFADVMSDACRRGLYVWVFLVPRGGGVPMRL